MIPHHERTLWFKLKKLQAADLLRPWFRLRTWPARRRLRRAVANGAVHRVLFTACNRGFGDVLIYGHALAAFRRGYPNTHTALMLRPAFVELATRMDLAHYYLPLGDEAQPPALPWPEDPDCIVDLTVERSPLVLELMRRQRHNFSLSFANACQGLTATRSLPLRRDRLLALQYFDLLRDWNLDPHAAGVRLRFTADEVAAVRTWLEQFPDQGPRIGFAPGSRITNLGQSRRWPADRFAALATRILQHYRAQIILLGSADEQAYCQAIADACGGLIYNAAGCFSYLANACLISKLQAFVSNDSSPVHMAALLGVPSLSFHKNGIDPWRLFNHPPCPKRMLEFNYPEEISVDAAWQAWQELAAETGLIPLKNG